MIYENDTLVSSDSSPRLRAIEQPSKPFPFEARANHLAKAAMAPWLRDLAKAEDFSVPGLDPIGWAVCRFMFEIAGFQARRVARAEMLKTEPPEAPWLYRDVFQLDRCDAQRRVSVQVPQDAMLHADRNGHAWFLAWQTAVWGFIGHDRALGRRPDHAPSFAMLTPGQAYGQLQEAWA